MQGKAGMRMYHDFEERRSRGDFSILPDLHATLSGMKVGGILSGGSSVPQVTAPPDHIPICKLLSRLTRV